MYSIFKGLSSNAILLYKMDIASEITILRQQQKDAIENCNFKDARILDQRIIYLKKQEKASVDDIAEVKSQINYEIEFSAAEADYAATRAKFLEKVIKRKIAFQQNEELLN